MDDLIEKLQGGCIYRPKRWSGDTHDDLGGPIDEAATDSLLAEAAEALEAARADAERYRWLCDNRLDVVGRIAGEGFVVTLRWADADICAATLDAAIDAARGVGNG